MRLISYTTISIKIMRIFLVVGLSPDHTGDSQAQNFVLKIHLTGLSRPYTMPIPLLNNFEKSKKKSTKQDF